MFGQAGNMRTHVRAVHEQRKYHACPQCGAAFGEASTLRAHVRVVHGQRRLAGFNPATLRISAEQSL
jgi:hypothetical protein